MKKGQLTGTPKRSLDFHETLEILASSTLANISQFTLDVDLLWLLTWSLNMTASNFNRITQLPRLWNQVSILGDGKMQRYRNPT